MFPILHPASPLIGRYSPHLGASGDESLFDFDFQPSAYKITRSLHHMLFTVLDSRFWVALTSASALRRSSHF